MLIKSVKTNKFCRVVDVGTRRQVLCDVPLEQAKAQATPFVYDGAGVSFGGDRLTNPGDLNPGFGTEPLYLGGSGSSSSFQPGALLEL